MEHLAAAAVVAAWPGSTTLARIRRRIALELATVRDGPSGPYSSLGARLSSSLRAKCPRLVADATGLCTPPDGALRFSQLLAPGPGSQTPHLGPEDFLGGAFLYYNRLGSDLCIVLDLPALIKWHSAGSPVSPRTPSETEGGARRYGDDGHAARRPGGPPLLPPPTSYDVVAGRAAGGGGGAASEAVAGDAALPPALTIEDLGLRAFPGPSAASELRRALVQRLGAAGPDGEDGLPPYTVPYRQLTPLVAASRAAAAHPRLTSASAFRAFLEHHDSAGAFVATRIPLNPNHPNNITNKPANNNNSSAAAAAAAAGGYVDCVQLVVPELRRAAAAGLAAAVKAAWPGGAPLQRLKRAAARVLAAAHTAAGPCSMNSGPLGNELIKREALAYSAVRSGTGAGGGLMLKLDESSWGGHLQYVRLRGEGCLRLRLSALLLEFPLDAAQDSALPLAASGSGAAAVTHGSAPPPHPPPSAPASYGTTGPTRTSAGGVGGALGRALQPPLGFSQPPPVAAPESPPVEASVSAAALLNLDQPSSPEWEPVASAPADGANGGAASDPWVRPPPLAGRPDLPVPVPVPVAFQLARPHGDEAAMTASGEVGGTVDGDGNGNGDRGSLWVPGESADSTTPPLQSQLQYQQQEQPPQQHLEQQQQQHLQLQHQAPPNLAEPSVQWVRTTPEFESMVQHCCAAGQVGLALHCNGGDSRKAEVAAIYAPGAATAAGVDPYRVPPDAATPGWPAVTYLIDCTTLSTGSKEENDDDVAAGGGGAAAAAAAAAAMLRCVLEDPGVVKVGHGCVQIAAVAKCCGASAVAPLLDTRVLLQALIAMLPPLPAPPPAAAAAGGRQATVGPLAAVAVAKLSAHVGGLRDALAGTGLWAERPELLGALTGRHMAALREEVFGAREWASNPAGHETALVAAARHLPELWEALANEAVPWVAMAAAATAMESALAATRH